MDSRRDEAKRSLPVLEDIRVASPCAVKWDDMVGNAHERHCAQCDQSVYNLSSFTRAQAQALVVDKQGKLCVQFFRRTDGTILTADCPDGVRKRRRKRRTLATAFSALSAMSAAAALSGGNPPPAPLRQADALRPPPKRAAAQPSAEPVAEAAPEPPVRGKKKSRIVKTKHGDFELEAFGAMGGAASIFTPVGVLPAAEESAAEDRTGTRTK